MSALTVKSAARGDILSFAAHSAVATFLAALFFSLPALARPSDEIETSELLALERALSGYITISFPAGRLNTCEVRPLSKFTHLKSDAYRNWYKIRIGSLCETGVAELASGDDSLLSGQEDVWFLCSRRNEVTCAVTKPAIAAEDSDGLQGQIQ